MRIEGVRRGRPPGDPHRLPRLAKTTVKGIATTSFSYDDLSRLDLVTDWLGGVNDHEYDANGNRQSLRHFNGVTTTYGFNDLTV